MGQGEIRESAASCQAQTMDKIDPSRNWQSDKRLFSYLIYSLVHRLIDELQRDPASLLGGMILLVLAYSMQEQLSIVYSILCVLSCSLLSFSSLLCYLRPLAQRIAKCHLGLYLSVGSLFVVASSGGNGSCGSSSPSILLVLPLRG